MTGLIGFHELHPNTTPIPVIKRLEPAYMVVFTTAKDFQQGVDRARVIKAASPNTEIILRVWPDDRLSSILRNADEWMERQGRYLSDDYILMIENEPNIDTDSERIISLYLDIMDLAGERGQRICWGAWFPGQPTDHEHGYIELLPLFRRSAEWAARGVKFVYGPHAYFDPAHEWHRYWLAFRQQIFAFRVCDANNVPRPPMVLTEYGFTKSAEHGNRLVNEGFRNMDYSAQRYALELQEWLLTIPDVIDDSYIVPVCIFASGSGMGAGWQSFDVNDPGFYNSLDYHPVREQPIPPPVIEPSPQLPASVLNPTHTLSKLSYGVHNTNIDDHLLNIEPPVILTMAGTAHAEMLAQRLPDTVVIHRGWNDATLHRDFSPAKWVERSKHLAQSNVVVHTTNEPPNLNDPNEARQIVQWHIDVIRLSEQYGLRLCILNFGAGSPDNWELYDELLRVVAEHRDRVYIGLHEYGSLNILSGIEYNGQDLTWQTWNELPLLGVDYSFWHIGRYKYLLNYCEGNNIAKPKIIFTEYGWDDLQDPKSKEKRANAELEVPPIGFDHYRSWRSLWALWVNYWPQWTHERAAFMQLIWAERYIYFEPEVIGHCLFAVSDDPMWKKDFDFSDAHTFQALVELNYRGIVVPPTTTPTIVEELDEILDGFNIQLQNLRTGSEMLNQSYQAISDLTNLAITALEGLEIAFAALIDRIEDGND